MFIGHLAVGFAAKRVAPRAPVTVLVMAATWLDLVWPVFLLLGIERVRIAPGIIAASPLDFESYPWSHSLLMTLVWAAVFAMVYRALTRDARGAAWVGALVASHWALDFLVHRPDLPLWPGGGPRVGLGLWASIPATIAIESVMMIAGIWLYLARNPARGWLGHVALASYLALLLFAYVSGFAGPPPPSVGALAWVGLVGGWISVPWMMWVDATHGARAPA